MPGGFPLALDVCNGKDVGTVSASSVGTTLTSGSGNNTKGSWVQLTASSPSDCCFALIFAELSLAELGLFTVSSSFAIDIAVGSSGNEKIVVNNLLATINYSVSSHAALAVPLSIPAGSRISARCQDAAGGSNTVLFSMVLFDGGFSQGEGVAGYDAIGFTPSGTGFYGTVATGSASPNTKGSWAQLVATTSVDYAGIVIVTTRSSDNVAYLLDIGIGGAGSEQVVVPNLPALFQNGVIFGNTFGFFIPIAIPAGTRLAARVQSANASATLEIALLAGYQ